MERGWAEGKRPAGSRIAHFVLLEPTLPMSRVLVQRLVDWPPPTVGIEARGLYPTVAAARRGHGASRALAGGEQAGALREAWRKCLLSRPREF